MPSTFRVLARSAVLAGLAAMPLAAVALPTPAHAATGVIISVPIEDPCAPLTPLCDPLPGPCPVIAPVTLPVVTDVNLTFAPCLEPFTTNALAAEAPDGVQGLRKPV